MCEAECECCQKKECECRFECPPTCKCLRSADVLNVRVSFFIAKQFGIYSEYHSRILFHSMPIFSKVVASVKKVLKLL
ncbi:hypothetical protein CAEBREN_28855 [Caenorhabditis brenneri]|uniref:Uncharacterized protein n=1 Tax=Caenorhabditis brenneri TaxID=135651 RepID=G0PFJ1_CAEBE|nr:hypothetical protein CAEBREN_28855 [Caenorhabditis brenneri]